MTNSYENVGSTIKRLREAKKLTQSQLAEMSGLSRSYLGSIEINSNNPSFDALKKISDALGVSVNVFLNDMTEINKNENKKLEQLIYNLLRNTENRKIEWFSFLRKQTPFDNLIDKNKYENWQQEGMVFTKIQNKFYILYPIIIDVLPSETEKIEYKFYILSVVYYDEEFKIVQLASSKDFVDIDKLYRLANPELMGKLNLIDDLISDIETYEISKLTDDDVPF